jgi:hypothetical protein
MTPPPIKPWGKADKKYLQKLINNGKVDNRHTNKNRCIDRIRVKFFHERDEKNFWKQLWLGLRWPRFAGGSNALAGDATAGSDDDNDNNDDDEGGDEEEEDGWWRQQRQQRRWRGRR